MDKILRAAGLESYQAQQVRIHDETVIVVHPAGDAQRLLRTARAALPDHNPILTLDSDMVLAPQCHHDRRPSDLITWAKSADSDTELARYYDSHKPDRASMGTGHEGYILKSYDVTAYGDPKLLVILPRPEPWTAFAYLSPYQGWGTPGPVVLAAARRWHEQYGAAATTIGIAIGFTVPRPPTAWADAERLAVEHTSIAGMTAGTTLRAYARALRRLNRWCLYTRP